MGSMVDRQKTRVEELIAKNARLTELIESLDIKVPNQRAARKMMEAIRIGLPPSASWWQIYSSLRMRNRAARENIHWSLFAYDQFKDARDVDNLQESTQIPQLVQDQVALIRQVIPNVGVFVKALKKDPWVIAERYSKRHGLEQVIVRGWDGDTILL